MALNLGVSGVSIISNPQQLTLFMRKPENYENMMESEIYDFYEKKTIIVLNNHKFLYEIDLDNNGNPTGLVIITFPKNTFYSY